MRNLPKIKLISDVHEEMRHGTSFYKLKLPQTEEDSSTVLVVAGDLNSQSDRLVESLRDWSEQFYHVIFVLGNHDYWHHCLEVEHHNIKNRLLDVDNVHVLENEYVTIDGVHFWGSTLWSDTQRDPVEAFSLDKNFSDYRMIKRYDANPMKQFQITTFDTTKAHKYSVYSLTESFLRNEELTGIRVVITHHAPSEKSCLEKYMGTWGSICFWTDLTMLLGKYDIDYWLHGHVHNSVDYEVYDTRIITNPVGYVFEPNKDFNPRFLLDLEKENASETETFQENGESSPGHEPGPAR